MNGPRIILIAASCLFSAAMAQDFLSGEKWFLKAQIDPMLVDTAQIELSNLCLNSDTVDAQIQACIWAGRLHDAKKQKKAMHEIAESLIDQWSEDQANSPEGIRLQTQLLMYQMDYRGAMFQVAHGKRLGEITLMTEQSAPDDHRSVLLRAIYELHAPKIAGGDFDRAFHNLQALSESEIPVVRFDALMQLCEVEKKPAREACVKEALQSFEFLLP